MKNRVVITGFGIVSAIGNNAKENLANLRSAKSGIERMRFLHSERTEFPVGEMKLSNQQMCDFLNIPYHRYISRTQLIGTLAVKESLEMSQLSDYKDIALISGTTVGGMDVTEALYPQPFPLDYPMVHDCGSDTNAIANYFHCFDYTSTISTACSSALNALIFAKLLIENGVRGKVIAGGTEALSKFHLNGFKSLMILDNRQCRPFDKTRAGLNLGEGAGFLVLESEQSAINRNATIYGVLSGVGNSCDAYHQTASSPNGEGAYLAMKQALDISGLTPSDIDYISAHGTGTPDNDAAESAAIIRLFGDSYPPTSSTKSLTGHTTSASGSIESVFGLLAILHNFIPKNANFLNPDENCICPFIDENPENLAIKNVLCNSFGFGGNDSSVIISRYE